MLCIKTHCQKLAEICCRHFTFCREYFVHHYILFTRSTKLKEHFPHSCHAMTYQNWFHVVVVLWKFVPIINWCKYTEHRLGIQSWTCNTKHSNVYGCLHWSVENSQWSSCSRKVLPFMSPSDPYVLWIFMNKKRIRNSLVGVLKIKIFVHKSTPSKLIYFYILMLRIYFSL